MYTIEYMGLNQTTMLNLDDTLTNDMTERYARKGFIISFVANEDYTDIYEVQKIDDPQNWDTDLDFIPPTLESDAEAKVLAIEEGFEFNDKINPYKVTGKH